MIDYELAKELKDAGFPQKADMPTGYTPEGGRVVLQRRSDFIYAPTLSELSEACGKELKQLVQGNGWWEARGSGEDAGGKTPEIAVANLWLELNKK